MIGLKSPSGVSQTQDCHLRAADMAIRDSQAGLPPVTRSPKYRHDGKLFAVSIDGTVLSADHEQKSGNVLFEWQ